VKIPGQPKPMEVVLVHPIERPHEVDENGKLIDNGHIPNNPFSQAALQKYKERFPMHNPDDVLKGAMMSSGGGAFLSGKRSPELEFAPLGS
jgi:hypothetical protein